MSAVRMTATLNGGAVIVAALYFGQELLVPLVLAGLLAFVLAPLARVLQRAYLPHAAAAMLAVVLAFVVIGLLSLVVGAQISSLANKAPEYQANILAKWQALVESNSFVGKIAEPLSHTMGDAGASPLALAERFARPLLGPVTTAAVVLVFTLVILLYSEDLRDRFVRLVGRHDLHRTIFALNDAGHRLSRYFLSQLTVNAGFGVWIAGVLALIGLPSPILLGLIAMLMRFVPYVGTYVALAPPLVLAIAVAPDWSLALIVLAVFAISDVIVGQVVEPLLYGHSTGISPVAVLVAASFWTLIWGLVGLLIATPLTVCLVVMGRNVAALSFLDVLFGSGSPLLPAETFYQRALEGRSLALLKPALAQIAETSRADYYNNVGLPALVLALQNRGDEVDDVDDTDPVHDQFRLLVDALAPAETPQGAGDWSRDGAILCLPGRGEFDDLANEMTAQALREAGFGVDAAPNTALDRPRTDAPAPRLCCLSMIEESATLPTIRFFVGSIRKSLPGTPIFVGLWGADSGSELLTARRAEGGKELLMLSLTELVSNARAISDRPPPRRVLAP